LGYSGGNPAQLIAILLPAETPVTSGRELPLKVHWGLVLAAFGATVAARAEALGPARPTAMLDTKRTHEIKKILMKRTSNTAAPWLRTTVSVGKISQRGDQIPLRIWLVEPDRRALIQPHLGRRISLRRHETLTHRRRREPLRQA
jgi:hypothetical protein